MRTRPRPVFLPLLLLTGTLANCASQPKPPPVLHVPPRLDASSAADIDKYYPLPSRELGEEGTCSVEVTVDPTGGAREVHVVSSTGFATLDDACVSAISSAHFEPATDDGDPVEARLIVPITWAIPKAVAPTLQRGYVLDVGDAAYPDTARRLHQEGDCIVGVFVQIDGTPHDEYIYQSSGFDALDQACLAAVRKALFAPGLKAGVAIAMPARITLSWRLGKY